MRYQFVQKECATFSVSALCRVMQVSKSGYHAFRTRKESARSTANRQITDRIRTVFAQSDQTYGSPRVHAELKGLGIACGLHRAARLMRKAAIRVVPARRFVATTDSKHALPVAANTLNREFTAKKGDCRWASDITYLWTSEGWLYLCVVLDLFSRRVVVHKCVNGLEFVAHVAQGDCFGRFGDGVAGASA